MMHLRQRSMRSLKQRLSRLLLLISLLTVGFVLTAHAQSSRDLNPQSLSTATSISASSVVKQDDPIAKKLEETANRLAVAEEKNRLLEEQLKAKDDRLAAKDERIANLTERLALRTDNQRDLTTVNTGDARMLQACELQLSKADSEISRLRHPGFLRSIFDAKAITGAALGFGVGRLTK